MPGVSCDGLGFSHTQAVGEHSSSNFLSRVSFLRVESGGGWLTKPWVVLETSSTNQSCPVGQDSGGFWFLSLLPGMETVATTSRASTRAPTAASSPVRTTASPSTPTVFLKAGTSSSPMPTIKPTRASCTTRTPCSGQPLRDGAVLPSPPDCTAELSFSFPLVFSSILSTRPAPQIWSVCSTSSWTR